jgi:hypothetical protein
MTKIFKIRLNFGSATNNGAVFDKKIDKKLVVLGSQSIKLP